MLRQQSFRFLNVKCKSKEDLEKRCWGYVESGRACRWAASSGFIEDGVNLKRVEMEKAQAGRWTLRAHGDGYRACREWRPKCV